MSDFPPHYDMQYPWETAGLTGPVALPEVTLGAEGEPDASDGLPGYEEDTSGGAFAHGYIEADDDHETVDAPPAVAAASGEIAVASAADEPSGEPVDSTPPADEPAEVPEPPTAPAGGSSGPPDKPPTGGEVLATPGDGDGDDENREPVRDPMDLPADDADALLREFFGSSEATPATREVFEDAVHELMQREEPGSQVDRHDFVVAWVGRPEGPRLQVMCSAEEHATPRGEYSDRHVVSVSVATTPMPHDPLDVIDNPPVERHFRDGNTTNYHLDDDAYTAALGELQLIVPEDTWRWLSQAQGAAAHIHNPSERKGAVEYLLNTAPDVLQPCRSTVERKQFIADDSTVTNIRWTEANPNFLNTCNDNYVTREVSMRTPDGVNYIYKAYRDGTEQLVAEAWEQQTIDELQARGFAAMRSGQAANIDSAARQMGVQRPSEALLRHFNELLRRATGIA
jgi:hypothetical protein